MEPTSNKTTGYTWFVRAILLVAVIALTLLSIRKLDLHTTLRSLEATPMSEVLAASCVFLVSRIFQTARFYTLYHGDFGFWRHVGLNMGSQAGIILLPFRAGELFRPYLMNRWNAQLPWSSLLFWLFVEKAIEFLTLLPLIVVAIWALNLQNDFAERLGLYALAAASLAILAYVFRERLAILVKRVRERRRIRSLLLWPLASSALSWLSWWALFYVFMPAWLPSLALSVAVILASSIPALPAGLGAFEAAFVWVATRWGMPAELALAKALVLHGIIIGWTLTWGLPYVLVWGLPKQSRESRV